MINETSFLFIVNYFVICNKRCSHFLIAESRQSRKKRFCPSSRRFIKSIKFIRSIDPSGRFIRGSQTAGKPCPKDTRDFIDFTDFKDFIDFMNFKSWKLNFINRAKSVRTLLPYSHSPLMISRCSLKNLIR